ncbi:MAG: sigma-70 family RNA polymerase sigma factor [Anaerolineales bacterium]
MDEQQAIARLKQGDLAGLEELVNLYQVLAVHTAYLVVADRPLAEDIVQSAFLKAAGKIRQFDAQRPFRPWFLRIVMNDSIKAAHRRKRNLSLEEASEDVLDWLTDPVPAPEAIVETAELRKAVWAALEQLPADQRAAVVQRHFLDMGEAEMARELKRPVSTVRWWLHAGRMRLKRLLGSGPESNSKDHA